MVSSRRGLSVGFKITKVDGLSLALSEQNGFAGVKAEMGKSHCRNVGKLT